ncbi:hypothetical protein SAMN05216573_1172 [Bradyrhizobium sp. Rc3b]|uniref:hypothetical protein n=1 Tax=Bradyrhizobium sp. Rc3b TaxID=1855322 RepID=UPI0008ED9A74|nr:hypothetical protein [Bradyrhizobium sp. Rc3b]SFN61910.1 hypothetical protein SAMN05216573_1172 [Bradyrhizobium sp. Rc3b]
MSDKTIVRLQTHRKNVERYLRLLETALTDVEQQYVEKRLAEEGSAMDQLSLQRAGAANAFHKTCNHPPSGKR